MYLHIGQETIIKTQDIIGIFDLDTSTVSKSTRNYLSKKEKEKKVYTICFDLPRSFVVTFNEKDGERVYISQLSSQTLLKRFGKFSLGNF